MEEPKISELEKLLEHFKNTNRSEELLAILRERGISGGSNNDSMPAIEPMTHEINPEVIVIENIRENEGLVSKTKKRIAAIRLAYKEKWYVRYGTYYVLLFILIFLILNAPLILNGLNARSYEPGPSQIIAEEEVIQKEMAKSAPLEPGEVVPSGTSLIVPKIGVNAPIQFLNTRDETTIQQKLTTGLVHYMGTADPGEVGNAFVTGHSSNFWWIKGKYNYVFMNLGKLAIGDQAKIYHKGNKYVYKVKEIKTVSPSNVSVLAQTDTPVLTLMTCTPPGTNWKRLIIVLDQIAPTYYKPQIVTKEVLVEPDRLPSTDSNSFGGLLAKIWDAFRGLFTD